jgi:glycosyltransferase involved in cell wall biosynthesis
MSAPAPLVSAVIPTYNRRSTAGDAVRSALDQDYRPLEVVVVDDGSTDDTLAMLAEFGDRIRIIRHRVNRGASAARNTGIEAARGEYVAFLDSDDLWRPEKTSTQLAFMVARGLALSCTGFRSAPAPGVAPVVKNRPYGERLVMGDLVWGIYVAPGTTLMARRRTLEAIGGYDAAMTRLEDWDLLLRAVRETGELGFLNADLAILHPSPGVDLNTLFTSADMLIERGLKVIADEPPGLARRFRAGVAFETAVALWKHGARTRSMAWLAKSLWLAPVGHQSLHIVLRPWLHARLLGPRRDR